MSLYMLQVAYTPEAWSKLVKKPQDRTAAIRPVVEKLGGALEHAWFSFGEYDVVCICNLPDNVSAAAFSIAVAVGGALKASKTTPLLTLDEGLDAIKKAGTAGYKPPK